MSIFFYDSLRFWMLPLAQINDLIPKKGTVVDLGCGEGVTVKYLAKIKTRKIIGVDNNAKRLQKSNQKNLKFELADIRKYQPKDANAIIISDVLHHINYEDQKNLLAKSFKSLKKGGVLLIKEIDSREFVRSRLSRFWDFVFYPRDKIYYQNSKDFKRYLQDFGFKVTITRPSRFFPGSTTLFLCQKN